MNTMKYFAALPKVEQSSKFLAQLVGILFNVLFCF